MCRAFKRSERWEEGRPFNGPCGRPQALLATPDALYAAANDAEEVTGIYTSTDTGRT